MNLGKMILELRKKKNVTQEDLASELGVTAAAVSKWENGYTLPDILMLCALADYFGVTTDELLGRTKSLTLAIAVAPTEALGQKIAQLTEKYGIHTAVILSNFGEVQPLLEVEGNGFKYLFTAGQVLSEQEMDTTNGLIHVNSDATSDEQILAGFEMYLQNMHAINSISSKNIPAVKKS